jgi:hypothetical protein
MSDSRYAPPIASVADFEPDAGSLALQRPASVSHGCRLLWIAFALGIPGLLYSTYASFELASQPGSENFPFWVRFGTLAISYLLTALFAFLTHMSWKGRNWARIINLALMVMGAVFVLYGFVFRYTVLEQSAIEWEWYDAITLSTMLLNVVGIGLLFSSAANAWYRAVKFARAR